MTKILLIISLISGAFSAIINYFSSDEAKTKIEQIEIENEKE